MKELLKKLADKPLLRYFLMALLTAVLVMLSYKALQKSKQSVEIEVIAPMPDEAPKTK